jgi:hypothetical protein
MWITLTSSSISWRLAYKARAIITRRKTEINDSINDSFFESLGLKLPINDSNNVFGFELLSMSRLCHLNRLCTRGYFSSKG